MAYVFWTHDLETGFKDIDEQHKHLVDCLEQLYVANETNDREKIGKVLEELIFYTADHFAYEERMLEEANYRLVDAHKKVHLNFVNKVLEYQQRFDNGEDVTNDMLNLLEGWLFRHIRINDMGFVADVKKAGIR
ncbi:MAG: bacteriohemerythrin [Kingella sp. (in: b-proteobacteria)]|nr:MAG: bacteriohemerythrin [Kingella sp. (in: b-proteobacteria)]